jgi:hypothetical protein
MIGWFAAADLRKTPPPDMMTGKYRSGRAVSVRLWPRVPGMGKDLFSDRQKEGIWEGETFTNGEGKPVARTTSTCEVLRGEAAKGR